MNALASRVGVIIFLFTVTAGWSVGKSTEPINAKCSKTCNLKNGLCVPNGTCRCNTGWKGSNCNRCEVAVGCRHGTCQKPGECNCMVGYGGRHCHLDMKYCERHHPCHNGGVCENDGGGSYTCSCPDEFTGKTCAIRLNLVVKPSIIIKNINAMPCLNGGRCTNHPCKGCFCPKGFAGDRCQTKVDMCRTRPCANGGTCRDLGGDFYCECSNGFVGKHCNYDVDECSLLGRKACENGGRCSNYKGFYKCQCKEGFEGSRCERSVHRIPTLGPTSRTPARPTSTSSPRQRVLENLFQNKNKFFTHEEKLIDSKSTNMKVRHSVIYSRVEMESLDPDLMLKETPGLDISPSSDTSSTSFIQILTFSLLGAGIFITLVMTSIVCSYYCKSKKGSNWCQNCFQKGPSKKTVIEKHEECISIVHEANGGNIFTAVNSSSNHKPKKTINSLVPPCEIREAQKMVDNNLYVALPEENIALTQNNTKQSSFLSSSESNFIHNTSRSNYHCNNCC